MAKATKPAPQEPELEEGEAPPKKSKKKLIVIIVAVAILLGGGLAAFLLLSPAPAPKRGGSAPAGTAHMETEKPAIFIDLGQFTVNLMREDEDRYLQITIALKITKPELEEKIKGTKPEILHRVNMLLQSKYPTELSTIDGKEKLALQIREQIEYVLGLRKSAPTIGAEPAASIKPGAGRSGVSDVLFTTFIIQ